MTRLPAVQIALNGTPIYLLNPKISASFSRDEKDMSGQQSGTLKADKGVKAKELSVSGVIPYRNARWLLELLELAEATSSNGEQVKYRVSSITAFVMNMREVVFSGAVSVSEQDNRSWAVSFKLREVNSVSEKKEQRKEQPVVKVQSETAPAVNSQSDEKQEVDNSVWKKLDDFAGKNDPIYNENNQAMPN